MNIEWHQLGERLVNAGSQCKSEAVLVAPFMKNETLQKIVSVLPPSASLLCLTRWRLEEIAIGVSDLECWDVISARGNSRLLLRSNLHAKYFRFDDTVYLGSANLTMTALGWSPRPNAEALVEFFVGDTRSAEQFESNLLDCAVDVTSDLAEEFKAMLKGYVVPTPTVQPTLNQDTAAYDSQSKSSVTALHWVPQSRSPEYLYDVYCGKADAVSKEGLGAARLDLLDLDLPAGLQRPEFIALVRSRLASTSIVAKLDRFLSTRHRFGEIRTWLALQLGVSDATDEWQRLMRWLLLFLPDRYESLTPGYSELFGRRSVSRT